MLKTFLLLSLFLQTQGAKPNHVDRMVEGWTVRLDFRLLQASNKDLGDQALNLLGQHLTLIKMRVASDKVARLQQVSIWMDLDCGDLERPQYHPGAEWLKDRGYLPEMAKGVHIPNAKYFVRRDFQMNQPLSVLHELAHSYHDQVLGFNDKEIAEAFEKFKADGKYGETLHSGGGRRQHYALTNPMEFFAEFTESYFNGNDFYPFNHGELRQAEPAIFELMRKIWGAAG